MTVSLTRLHSGIWSDIESRFIPFSKGDNSSRLWCILPLLVEVPVGIAVSCLQAVNKTLSYIVSFSPFSSLPHPGRDFGSVLKDSREVKRAIALERALTLLSYGRQKKVALHLLISSNPLG